MKLKHLLVLVSMGVILLGSSGNAIAEEIGYVTYKMECGIVCFDFGEWGYCTDNCEDQPACSEETKPTSTPVLRTPVPRPTNTNAPTPSTTPVPNTTPAPSSTPKPKCDQGRGNGDDGCSPGNSDHRHGPNDPKKGPRSVFE